MKSSCVYAFQESMTYSSCHLHCSYCEPLIFLLSVPCPWFNIPGPITNWAHSINDVVQITSVLTERVCMKGQNWHMNSGRSQRCIRAALNSWVNIFPDFPIIAKKFSHLWISHKGILLEEYRPCLNWKGMQNRASTTSESARAEM